MNPKEQQLKRIHDKLQQLLKSYAALQKENKQLKAESDKGKHLSSHHQKTIDALKQKVEVLKLNTGEMKPADKKEFERRINSHLKEIDRCIALLND